jgi:hypothetical protein
MTLSLENDLFRVAIFLLPIKLEKKLTNLEEMRQI